MSLRFKREPSGVCGDRLVREAQFERVSDLQLSTVCNTANRARDQLSQLLGRELTLDVFAPALVRSGSDRVLFDDGVFYVATGASCDAYVVFRDRDGHRLAAAAFGEERDGSGPLSALEERALERIAGEIVRLCVPLCGEVRSLCRGDLALEAPLCVTFFELRIGSPIDAVIGIGLSKDPGPAFGTTLDRSMLARVTLDVRAEFAEARIEAHDVGRWSIGTTVRLDTPIGSPTTLKVGDCVIATGEGGIRAAGNAVSITSTPFAKVAP